MALNNLIGWLQKVYMNSIEIFYHHDTKTTKFLFILRELCGATFIYVAGITINGSHCI